MDYADVGYLFLLLFSLGFGNYYKTIKDVNNKKLIGSVVGFFIILFVSGVQILHVIVTVLVNAIIIVGVDKRKCHIVSLVFTFSYLLFFRTSEYFGIPYASGYTNMVQMVLTLKLIGLAFEVNSSYMNKKKKDTDLTEEQKIEEQYDDLEVSFVDVLHYSFNYITVLTGPYIRFRTFNDYFRFPYWKHADWKTATYDKVKWIPFCLVLFLITSNLWPIDYLRTEEFYERSFFYRLWYVWPTFMIFRTRIYIALLLAECSCVMAGLGAYPLLCDPKYGQGPSKSFKELLEIAKDETKLQTLDYDFETIRNVDPYQAEFCPSARDTMKQWNRTIQYWLAVYIYKRFPIKAYRIYVTMLVSAYWHGVYTGYYVCIGCTPFVFPVDGVWYKLVLKDATGIKYKLAHVFMVIFKMFFFSYLSVAFCLMTMDWIFYYYNSVYHAAIIIGVAMYFVGTQLLVITGKKGHKNKDKENAASKVE